MKKLLVLSVLMTACGGTDVVPELNNLEEAKAEGHLEFFCDNDHVWWDPANLPIKVPVPAPELESSLQLAAEWWNGVTGHQMFSMTEGHEVFQISYISWDQHYQSYVDAGLTPYLLDDMILHDQCHTTRTGAVFYTGTLPEHRLGRAIHSLGHALGLRHGGGVMRQFHKGDCDWDTCTLDAEAIDQLRLYDNAAYDHLREGS